MKKKILFILCLLAGLLFINAGLNKFFNYMPPPDNLPEAQMNLFLAMMQIGWLMPLIAIAEIVGGMLFIVPRFRALGAIMLTPVLTGIMIAHFTVAPEGMLMAVCILAVWLWVIVENRQKLFPLVKS
jgi:uncharacterized membrane protein YphA (DoxX/SURF4 family)